MDYKLNQLLQNVAIIQEKYDEEANKNGENFNVFAVMNMEHSEVSTHSAIIGELLNPNGSHGQKDFFLRLFIAEIKKAFESGEDDNQINKLTDFGTLVNDKICERTISLEINWENVTGGRIDLIVEDHKQILIIENKLYAIDQPLQLIRYDNYAKTKGKDYHILYLTLFGKELEKEEKLDGIVRGYNFMHTEIGEYKIHKEDNQNNNCLYHPISFEVHIRDWIVKCLEKPDLKPLLKATLEQYLVLIKRITFQTMTEKMKEEITETILSNTENIKSVFTIVESIENLKKKLYDDLIRDLKNNTEGYQIVDTNHNDYYGVDVRFEGFENVIRVLFGKKKVKEFYSNVSCGFQIDVEMTEFRLLEYRLKGFEVNYNWVYKWINSGNWGVSPAIWEDVAKGKDGKTYNEIISVIKEIIEIENVLVNN